MAQQTQIDRVVPFYRAWLKKYPTLKSLARSSKGDVLRLWSGLGYNNRALRFHRLANVIAEHYNGSLPKTAEALDRLPGVGRYTAHAVACFAFGAEVPLVDVNIRRVYTRLFSVVRGATDLRPEKEIWAIALEQLPRRGAHEWNQALMELGALVCTARNPRCGECPINRFCPSAFSKNFSKKTIQTKSIEPSFKGIPRRIYRGKILKALHAKPLTPRQLGRQVVKRFHPRDLKWLDDVVMRMERDELIHVQQNGRGKKIRIAK
ncbi:MAG TPA: A/G-specific adenine glycosylase [Bacteroidota bacterium]|nr:A/G-specific adenine glycosylase [Bacteroidota bacterium]